MPQHTDQPRHRVVLRIRRDPLETALRQSAERHGRRRATEFSLLVRQSLAQAEPEKYKISDAAWCCFLDRDRLNGPTASPQISLYFTESELEKMDALAEAAGKGSGKLTRAQLITSLLVEALLQNDEL